MNISVPLLLIASFFVVIILLCHAERLFQFSRIKGKSGEWAVRRELEMLDCSIYQSYHDLYIPRPDGGGTTQIDHVVVSPFGIFVIETKNYAGLIYGSPKQSQWTQQIYRRKNRFQNPLHQNDLHVRALSAFLGISRNRMIPFVLFAGTSTFMTPMPANALNRGIRNYIRSFTSHLLTPPELTAAKEVVAQLDRDTNRKTAANTHIRGLRGRNSNSGWN